MKLPPITNRGAAPLPTSNPALAELEYNSKQSVINAVQDVAAERAEAEVDYQINRADNVWHDEMHAIRRQGITKTHYTADEIEQLGMEDQIEVADPETGERHEAIPGWKVHPLLVERKLDESRQRLAETIHDPRRREAWVSTIRSQERSEIEGALVRARNMSQREMIEQRNVDLDQALTNGHWQTARNIVDDPQYSAMIGPEATHQLQKQIAAAEFEASSMGDLMSAGVRFARAGNESGVNSVMGEMRDLVAYHTETGAIPTREAGQQMIEKFHMNLAIEQKRSQIRQGLDSDRDVAETAQMISEFRDADIPGMTVQQQEDTFKLLVSDLNTHLSLRAKQEDADDKASEQAKKQMSERLYLGILTNETDQGDVTMALSTGTINQSQAENLVNILNNRGRGADDYTLIRQINEDIDSGAPLDQVLNDIMQNTGTRLTESTAGELSASARAYHEDESPLQTNNAKRAKEFITRSMRVTGPFGSLDVEAERRLARAHRDFASAVLRGEDPFKAADRLVERDTYTRARNPRYGTKDDLEGAMERTRSAFGAGEIDDETFNFEVRLIENLIRQRDTLKSFDEALKQHAN